MITATQRRMEQQQKAVTEGTQFRILLWPVAESLPADKTLTVTHDSARTWGEHHLSVRRLQAILLEAK